MRNSNILAVAAIIFSAIVINAQSLMNEGTRPIRDLNCLYEKTYDSTYRPSNTNYSEKSNKQEVVLDSSSIPDKEIAEIDSASEA